MAAMQELLAQALALPDDAREELAHALLDSLDDDDDDLDDEDRQRLHEALARSGENARAGRVRPASELISKLRARPASR